MSASSTDPHAGDHHGEQEFVDHDTMHITVGGYVTGFVLSVILTAIPFWLVMGKVFASSTATTFVILGFAMVQIFVHMVFFLHMIVLNSRTGLSMCLGETSIVTPRGCEAVTRAPRQLVVN